MKDSIHILALGLFVLFFSCKKEEPVYDPDDPYNNEFIQNYLVDISVSDSNATDWIITNEWDYDRVVRVQFDNGILYFDGGSFVIQEISEISHNEWLYSSQNFGQAWSQFMNCTLNEGTGSLSSDFVGHNDPNTGDLDLRRTYTGSKSSLPSTPSLDIHFSSLSGTYEMTYENDYIDDTFDTTYVDTVEITFDQSGFTIKEQGYTALPFHSYYHHKQEENDQDSSYIISEFTYQINSDSVYVLDQFRLVNDGVPAVWSDRKISGVKL